MAAVRLTDQQMRGFIRDGYAVVKTQLPREVHQDIWDQTEALFESEGNPGNNLMARIPDMRLVFDDPAVDGALAGVLGDSYYMHPHRHCHYRPPHSEGQQIHKDSFTRRRHRTRWILAMYYPQDTTVDMGPTAVVTTGTGLTISLTSLRTVPLSLGMVTSIGLDPADFHIIVAKGVHAPVAAFGPVCSELIRVDTVGATAADMRTFEYRYRRQPMYPFEEIA